MLAQILEFIIGSDFIEFWNCWRLLRVYSSFTRADAWQNTWSGSTIAWLINKPIHRLIGVVTLSDVYIVQITVIDKRKVPKFVATPYQFRIGHLAVIGTPVGRLQVSGFDQQHVRYAIKRDPNRQRNNHSYTSPKASFIRFNLFANLLFIIHLSPSSVWSNNVTIVLYADLKATVKQLKSNTKVVKLSITFLSTFSFLSLWY